MSHKCHAQECGMEVHPSKLMCPAHWKRVPSEIQKAVCDAYSTGQYHEGNRPSKEWLKAARAAIISVAPPCPVCSGAGGSMHRNCILR